MIPANEGRPVEKAFGLEIPQTLEEACDPRRLALLVAIYSLITFSGMILFGRGTWLRHGDPFAAVFGLFARFSPTEVRVIDPAACRECQAGLDCGECFDRAAPAMRGASCCETLKAAAPVRPAPAVAQAPAVSLSPAAPVELPFAPAAAAPLAALPDPPPLHEGIGLYTLHATFLI